MYIPHFVHPLMDATFNCFYLLATVNYYDHEYTNTCLSPSFHSFGYIPRSRIGRSFNNFVNFSKELLYCFIQLWHHFKILPALHKCSNFPTVLPILKKQTNRTEDWIQGLRHAMSHSQSYCLYFVFEIESCQLCPGWPCTDNHVSAFLPGSWEYRCVPSCLGLSKFITVFFKVVLLIGMNWEWVSQCGFD
jgi:hypothetical protein